MVMRSIVTRKMEKFVPIAMALMIAGGCGCKEALVLESGEEACASKKAKGTWIVPEIVYNQ